MNLRHLLTLAALTAVAGHAQANIDIRFDYTYDTGNFFADASRKLALESAAQVFESFADRLTAINSSSSTGSFDVSFFNPSNPGLDISLTDFNEAANIITVYVGATDLPGSTLGQGGPGGFSCSGFGSYCSTTPSRGQGVTQGASAVDVAPWGGAIAFDNAANWYFGSTTSGLTSSQADFYSVATHELAHLLGFGTSDSFGNQISGSQFVGDTTGTVALANEGHWALGTTSLANGVSQEAAMTPSILFGTRKYFTTLDYAAMKDIGWETSTVPESSTTTLTLAGLAGIALAAKRRRKA